MEEFTLASDELHLFPNPAQNQLSLVNKQYAGRKAVITITNNLSVTMLQEEVEEMPAQALALDLHGLRDGLYFLTIRSEGCTSETKRFVIMK